MIFLDMLNSWISFPLFWVQKREDDGTENTQSEDEDEDEDEEEEEEDEDEVDRYDTSSISEEEMESWGK